MKAFANSTSWKFCAVDDDTNARMVVYSSTVEEGFSLTAFFIFFVVTLPGQTSVIATIWKTESLRTPHFLIIFCCCIGDLIMVVTAIILFSQQYLAKCMILWVCQAMSNILIATGYSLANVIGLMAFERYLYFCHPMRYQSILKAHVLATVIIAIFAAPNVYCAVTEFLIGRQYHSSVLGCNFGGGKILIQSTIQLLCFLMPPAVVTIVSTYKIWRLLVQVNVAPVAPDGAVTQSVAPGHQATKVIRMILLVSGTFWGTYLPSIIMRVTIFSLGITWEDVNSRDSLMASMLIRTATILFTCVSSTLNPFIYYYSRRDLRQACFKLMGIHRNAIAPDTTATGHTQTTGM